MSELSSNETQPVDDLLVRSLRWIYRRTGKATLLVWALLLVMLGSVISGMAGAVRELDVNLLLEAGLFGLLLGWLLGRSRFTGWMAALLGLTLGVSAIFFRIGQLAGQLYQVILAANGLALYALRWHPLAGAPDPAPLLQALSLLGASLTTLWLRMVLWLAALRAGTAGFDPVASSLVWSLAVCLSSIWAGWWVRRRRPLEGAVPLCALLGICLAYSRGPAGFLPFVMVTVFLLIAWNNYSQKEERWDRTGIDFSEDLRLEVGAVALFLAAGITAFATIAPFFSLNRINTYISQLRAVPAISTPPPLGQALGLKQRPAPTRIDPLIEVRSGGLPREHLIGAGPELSQQVVMTIKTGDFPAGPPEMLANQALPHYYWRSLDYDIYNGHGWGTGPTWNINYPPEQAILTTGYPATRLITQTVKLERDQGGMLYRAGDLAWVDQPAEVAWRTSIQTQNAVEADIFGANTVPRQYQAHSFVTQASSEQLKAAGQAYPDWVRKRYLALPDSLPGRVKALARDLTATQLTPYDQAKAIESYLRTFPYTLDLPPPPTERDLVDYFLFDLKKGYCDYYASAMVVLARAAGLPARLVIGYATGTYDPYSGRYVVTEADAHSWPEIYFPGYGWVEFEPTAALAVLDRSQASGAPSAQPQTPPEPQQSPLVKVNWHLVLLWAGLLAGIAALLALAWQLSEDWLLTRLPPLKAVTTIYQRLYRQGERLNPTALPGDTPYEYAAELRGRLERLAGNRQLARYLAPAGQEVSQLTDLYNRALYSPRPLGKDQQSQAIHLWQRLRWRMWLARLGRIYFLKNPLPVLREKG